MKTGIQCLGFSWGWLLLFFSHSVTSDSLLPHGPQYTRLPCPSLSPRVCSSSCSLSQWCHPTISSSVTPFSACPQSFPASESSPMNQLFASGGQGIGASVAASVLPVNTQGYDYCSLNCILWICWFWALWLMNPHSSCLHHPVGFNLPLTGPAG